MDVFVFVFGLVVTIVAVGAVATIWWAAIGDGRTESESRAARAAEETGVAPQRSAA